MPDAMVAGRSTPSISRRAPLSEGWIHRSLKSDPIPCLACVVLCTAHCANAPTVLPAASAMPPAIAAVAAAFSAPVRNQCTPTAAIIAREEMAGLREGITYCPAVLRLPKHIPVRPAIVACGAMTCICFTAMSRVMSPAAPEVSRPGAVRSMIGPASMYIAIEAKNRTTPTMVLTASTRWAASLRGRLDRVEATALCSGPLMPPSRDTKNPGRITA
mmetsp:Transcript_34991/g.110567  ORF Transcript_34991/g.110567 Transcript_34991/m.110567 type:complete len:216 (+) Transcript_34991:128-775(+)